MEQRDSMQKYNLVYDENTKKYCLPFDNSELSNCEFVKHNFLGKPKLCIIDNKVLNPKDSMDFVYKDTLMKNFEVNFSEKINSSIRNTMSYGIVMLIHNLERKNKLLPRVLLTQRI